jgi:hypothetical protein
MPNFTVSKPLHVALYILAAIITAVTHLVTGGNIKLTAPVVAVLGLVLSAINSIDPQVVLAKASPEALEKAAKRLPAATLARLSDAAKLQSVPSQNV